MSTELCTQFESLGFEIVEICEGDCEIGGKKALSAFGIDIFIINPLDIVVSLKV